MSQQNNNREKNISATKKSNTITPSTNKGRPRASSFSALNPKSVDIIEPKSKPRASSFSALNPKSTTKPVGIIGAKNEFYHLKPTPTFRNRLLLPSTLKGNLELVNNIKKKLNAPNLSLDFENNFISWENVHDLVFSGKWESLINLSDKNLIFYDLAFRTYLLFEDKQAQNFKKVSHGIIQSAGKIEGVEWHLNIIATEYLCSNNDKELAKNFIHLYTSKIVRLTSKSYVVLKNYLRCWYKLVHFKEFESKLTIMNNRSRAINYLHEIELLSKFYETIEIYKKTLLVMQV